MFTVSVCLHVSACVCVCPCVFWPLFLHKSSLTSIGRDEFMGQSLSQSDLFLCFWPNTFALPSQQLVLSQVHPLDDVSTVIEDTADVFRVDSAGKVGVTVVSSIPACCADPL